jgi:hypothetical protein
VGDQVLADPGGGTWRPADPLDALTDEQRDRLIVRLIAALALGFALLLGGLLAASALGRIGPNCPGELVNNRVGRCYVDPDDIVPTPDGWPQSSRPELVVTQAP